MGRKYAETASHGAVLSHGEWASGMVVVCYDIRANDLDKRRCGRLKFVLQCVDFSALYKIAKLFVETAPHGAVLCSRDGCSVVLSSSFNSPLVA